MDLVFGVMAMVVPVVLAAGVVWVATRMLRDTTPIQPTDRIPYRRRRWPRAPLTRFYVFLFTGGSIFIWCWQAGELDWGTLPFLGTIAGVFVFRCAWCGNHVMRRFSYLGGGRWPQYAFPFDADCGNCHRSMWTVPPEPLE